METEKNIRKALGKVKKKEIAFLVQHLTESTMLSGASSFKSMVVTIYNNQDKEATQCPTTNDWIKKKCIY